MKKFSEMFRTLTPAYGRDYKSQAAAVADFRDNKDWILQPDGKPINIEQIEPGTVVNLRYSGLRRVKPVTV